MRINKLFCDDCGKDKDNDEELFFNVCLNVKNLHSILNTGVNRDVGDMDLCQTCYNELISYVNNKPKINIVFNSNSNNEDEPDFFLNLSKIY